MKKIMMTAIVFLICTSSWALLPTPTPTPGSCTSPVLLTVDGKTISPGSNSTLLENEIGLLLKKVYQLESKFFADHAYYTTSFLELGLTLPYYLAANGNFTLKVKADRSGFEAVYSTLNCKKFLIREDGLLQGMHQFYSFSDIEKAITEGLYYAFMAETSYYADWFKYTTDFAQAGFLVPLSLKDIGTFNVTVPTPSTFIITFTVTAPYLTGMKGKVYRIDQTKKLTY